MAASAPAAAAPSAPAAAAPGKKFNWLFVIVPLLALALVGVGVGWEVFRSRMEALQQGQGGEARLGVLGGPTGPRDRRSREVKVSEAPVAPPVVEDELTGLGKKKKPPPPKPVGTLAPADRAWRAVKGDFDRLEARNESTARKYRMRMLTLEGNKAGAPEASFVKEAGALEEELRGELAKPENQ